MRRTTVDVAIYWHELAFKNINNPADTNIGNNFYAALVAPLMMTEALFQPRARFSCSNDFSAG